MIYLLVKAAISGVLIAIISEIARRSPAFAALIASLPLVSLLGVIWLWRDTSDIARIADHTEATFWFVIPSLPMFLIIPALLRRGLGFWPSILAGVTITVLLYFLMVLVGKKIGLSF